MSQNHGRVGTFSKVDCTCMNVDCASASAVTSNVVMPRRPATAMDNVIKENVVQPPVIRPKPLPVTGAAGVIDQVLYCIVL